MMRFTLTILLFLSFTVSYSQVEKKYIRKGNKEYNNDKYAEAELDYRKAIDKKPDSRKANYNLGNSLYKQDKFEAARTKYENLAVTEGKDKLSRSKYYYNLGNTYFKENKFKESIEAYKNALRNNPGDADVKHNLQLAQNIMDAQQQQQQQQQEQQKKNEEEKDNQQQQEQKEQQQQQQQQQLQQISHEDAERLLDEISREEKDVLKKVQLQKASVQKVPVDKNW